MSPPELFPPGSSGFGLNEADRVAGRRDSGIALGWIAAAITAVVVVGLAMWLHFDRPDPAPFRPTFGVDEPLGRGERWFTILRTRQVRP